MIYKSIVKDFCSYGLISGITRISGIILLPLFTSSLTINQYGKLDFIQTGISLISILVLFNINSGLARYWNYNKFNHSKQQIFSVVLKLLVVFLIFLSIIICLIINYDLFGLSLYISKDLQFVCYGSIVITTLLTIFEWALRLDRRILYFGLSTVVYLFVNVSLVLYFNSKSELSLHTILEIQLISLLLKLIILFLSCIKYITRTKISFDYLYVLKFSLPMVPATIANIINSKIDKVVILYLLGSSSLGLYAAILKFSIIVTFLCQNFKNTWVPLSLQIMSKNDRDKIYQNIFSLYLLFSFIISLTLFFCTYFFVSVYLPTEYIKYLHLLPLTFLPPIISTLVVITNIGVVIKEQSYLNSLIYPLSFIINLFLSFYLVNSYGVIGVCVGTIISSFFCLICFLIFSIKNVNIQFNMKHLTIFIFSYTMVCILAIINNVY